VVLREDGEGLLASARVVATFCGLDGFAGLDSCDEEILVDCSLSGRWNIRVQPGADGYAPLVLEVAGSSVALMVATKAQAVRIDASLNISMLLLVEFR